MYLVIAKYVTLSSLLFEILITQYLVVCPGGRSYTIYLSAWLSFLPVRCLCPATERLDKNGNALKEIRAC